MSNRDELSIPEIIIALGIVLFLLSLLLLVGLAMTKSPATIHTIYCWSGYFRVFGIVYAIDGYLLKWDIDNNLFEPYCQNNETLSYFMNFISITVLVSLIYVIIHFNPIVDRLAPILSFFVIGLAILSLISLILGRFVYDSRQVFFGRH